MSKCSHPEDKISFHREPPHVDIKNGDSVEGELIWICEECGESFDHNPSIQPEYVAQDENLSLRRQIHD